MMMMIECDKCENYSTVEVTQLNYPYKQNLCSLHAIRHAESQGATPGELAQLKAQTQGVTPQDAGERDKVNALMKKLTTE